MRSSENFNMPVFGVDRRDNKRNLARSAAETRRRRLEFESNSLKWVREETVRIEREIERRKRERSDDCERFLRGRRSRSSFYFARSVAALDTDATTANARKSMSAVTFAVESDDREHVRFDDADDEVIVRVPRHSEPDVRFLEPEERTSTDVQTREDHESPTTMTSISWWNNTSNDEEEPTEGEKRQSAIRKLRERSRTSLVKHSKTTTTTTNSPSSTPVNEEEVEREQLLEKDDANEEQPKISATSPRQNLQSKRFRLKQEVSESKDFAGQEAKLLASIARLDEVVKRNDLSNHLLLQQQASTNKNKNNRLKQKQEVVTVIDLEEEAKRAQENALMRSIARLDLKLELTNDAIQIFNVEKFHELLLL